MAWYSIFAEVFCSIPFGMTNSSPSSTDTTVLKANCHLTSKDDEDLTGVFVIMPHELAFELLFLFRFPAVLQIHPKIGRSISNS
jgi:hypothetical protein